MRKFGVTSRKMEGGGERWSSRVSFNGPRKFGVCNGSCICENSECTKVTTEGVQNKIEFKQQKCGGYTCKCCGYYVQKEVLWMPQGNRI